MSIIPTLTQEELIDALDRLNQDQKKMKKLLYKSQNEWSSNEPGELVQQAFEKMLNAAPGTFRKDRPIHNYVIKNMKWIATDWGGKRSRRGEVELDENQHQTDSPFGALEGLQQEISGFYGRLDREIFITQVKDALYEAAQKKSDRLFLYCRLRFECGLEGKSLREAMEIDSMTEFASLTKAAYRLYQKTKETLKKKKRS